MGKIIGGGKRRGLFFSDLLTSWEASRQRPLPLVWSRRGRPGYKFKRKPRAPFLRSFFLLSLHFTSFFFLFFLLDARVLFSSHRSSVRKVRMNFAGGCVAPPRD